MAGGAAVGIGTMAAAEPNAGGIVEAGDAAATTVPADAAGRAGVGEGDGLIVGAVGVLATTGAGAGAGAGVAGVDVTGFGARVGSADFGVSADLV
jgi:hypothetical protein